jgi:hypothetical protein
MAVSATASAATVFVVVIAFAVATTIATTVTSASTTLVTHAGEQILYLFGCSIAVLEYGALELQSLACQGMVGIEGHTVVLNLGDVGHEVLFVLTSEGDDGTRIDICAVELAINLEKLATKLADALLVVFAKSLGGGKGEVEGLVLVQCCDVGLETVE